MIRTVTAVERADVVVVDDRRCQRVLPSRMRRSPESPMIEGKGVIIAVNKWDAIEKNDKTIYRHTEKYPSDSVLYAICRDRVYLLQKQARGFPETVSRTIDMLSLRTRHMRIQTGVLNEILAEAVAMQQPPSDRGRTPEDLLHDSGCGEAADICYLS